MTRWLAHHPRLLWTTAAGLVGLNGAALTGHFPPASGNPVLAYLEDMDPLVSLALRAWLWTAPALAGAALGAMLPDLAATTGRSLALVVARLHHGGDTAAAAAGRAFTWRVVLMVLAGGLTTVWAAYAHPWPAAGTNPVLDAMQAQDPLGYLAIRLWSLVVPGLAAGGAVMVCSGAWRVWLERRRGRGGRGVLPRWPVSPSDPAPGLVIGEVHHPTKAEEIGRPQWLTIPERGLYTGVAIFGAVGSGKTSACMHPFATQLFGWQAGDPQKRPSGLVLEVKGDFCYDVQAIFAAAGRRDDYIELGLGGSWQWNPLHSTLDSYSLAYTVASLLNQLFGKSKEPFWQQAYTNLVRWIIELHWALPGRWCTFRDVYHLAIDPQVFAERIAEARRVAGGDDSATPERIIVPPDVWDESFDRPGVGDYPWTRGDGGTWTLAYDQATADHLTEAGVAFLLHTPPRTPSEHLARVEAVERWYQHDWLALDTKLRTSIIEGISVFLSMFDLPDVARVFCPPAPSAAAGAADNDIAPPPPGMPPSAGGRLLRPLPNLGTLIESGKVLALNMPAGANPALGRAIGVLLKNAWLQTLLRRPAAMKRQPGRYVRPAVFLCDEYQSFATVGEDDPSGDEKSFALTRQCRCIPIVATQSISSLRSVLSGQDAWRALIQTLRTRIFLSLSDDSSAELASTMCGKILRLSPSYSFSEQSKPGFSILTARGGGGKGSLGASKSFRELREPVFHPRTFALLENCQAIVLPYDGTRALPATRAYLKPHYLDRERSYWRARAAGEL